MDLVFQPSEFTLLRVHKVPFLVDFETNLDFGSNYVKKKKKRGGGGGRGSPTCQHSFAEQSVQNDLTEDAVKRL